MKTIKRIICSICVLLFFVGCNPLEKENLAAIGSNDVWGNPAVATAYVNDIYGMFMPSFTTWSFVRNTEECMVVNSEYAAPLSAYLDGTLTENTYNDFPYDGIRKINIFLEGIDGATFDDATKTSLKGQAQFWRAWAYFRMVRAYGGVPLVLVPAPPDDQEAIFVPRNKTSECIAQILKDIDEAIPLLQDKSTDGHIDKCAAMSFKGRVLLYYASPQFNRNNDIARWNTAYQANKSAVDFLNSQGKGLYPEYGELWTDEMNKEVIMVKRFQYPSYANGYSQACMRPLLYARGCVGNNYPSLELVNAYPMKDGSKWDPATMDYRLLHQNRDKRFYASIAYNGAKPYISPMFGNENMWTYAYDSDGDPATGENGKEARADNNSEFGSYAENLFCHAGFYSAKMLDRTITRTTVEDGQVDWIEIRYAEVLMNLAECANEIGETAEALELLYQIRERAGIESGSGNYGITATAVPDIRKAIQDERLVEFAFEEKRFWDLRRWRIYASTFNNFEDHIFHGLRIEYNGTAATRPVRLTDINTVWDQFTITVNTDFRDIIMRDEDIYSFLGIPTSVIERNNLFLQNDTWGGTFDPLE